MLFTKSPRALYLPGLILFIASFYVNAQDNDNAARKLSDNLYLLKAQNTNIGVLTGADSTVVIDSTWQSENMPNNEVLYNKIKALSNKPIKFLINTHAHPDHRGGNELFSNIGATVIAHENAPDNAIFNPSLKVKSLISFSDNFKLETEGESIHIEHIAAHTFGDALIHFEKNNVLFVGDNLTTGWRVYLGIFGLDSIDTWVDRALELSDDNTKIIPGHGASVLSKQELIKFRQDIHNWVEYLRKQYQQGASVDELVKDKKALKLMGALNYDNVPVETYNLYTDDRINELVLYEFKQPFSMTDKMKKSFVGLYKNDTLEDIEISFKYGRVIARQKGAFIGWLRPQNEHEFELLVIMGSKGEVFSFNHSKQLHIKGQKEGSGLKDTLKPNTIWTKE